MQPAQRKVAATSLRLPVTRPAGSLYLRPARWLACEVVTRGAANPDRENAARNGAGTWSCTHEARQTAGGNGHDYGAWVSDAIGV
jgi:hypothetical protein